MATAQAAAFYNPPASPIPIRVLNHPALAEAVDRIKARAFRTAREQIKNRARRYSEKPALLEILWSSLSWAEPEKMIWIGTELLAQERDNARRHAGFGGDTAAINARAIILLGRARRLAARRA